MSSKNGKAILFNGAGKPFELMSFPLPQVEPKALLVKTLMCTVCGSDMHTWQGRRAFPVPSILGHEIVGSIAAMGESVDRDCYGEIVSVGDRITWTITAGCGACLFCRLKGLPQKCLRFFKYGHAKSDVAPHFTGGFAEYVYLKPGTCFFKIPQDMKDEEAAPLMCAAATVAAGLDAVGTEIGENVVIQGAGMLGLYAIAMLKERNSKCIVAIDVSDDRLRIAEDFGADIVINPVKEGLDPTLQMIAAATGGIGADLVVEATGDPDVIQQGAKMLRSGGRYLLAGAIYPNSRFTIDAHDVITKCLTLKGMYNYDAKHLGTSLSFVYKTKEKYPYAKIIGPKLPLTVEGLTQAMRLLKSRDSIRPAILA